MGGGGGVFQFVCVERSICEDCSIAKFDCVQLQYCLRHLSMLGCGSAVARTE